MAPGADIENVGKRAHRTHRPGAALSDLTGSIPDNAREGTPGDESDAGGRETPKQVTIQGKSFITENKEMCIRNKMSSHKMMSAPSSCKIVEHMKHFPFIHSQQGHACETTDDFILFIFTIGLLFAHNIY